MLQNAASDHSTCIKEIWESGTPKNCPGTSKNQCQEVWDSQLLRYLVIYNKNLEWIYVFSLRMAVLLHKWEFKNTEVEFLKVSEKIWSSGLPDIGARKSWDFLILTVTQLVQALWSGSPLLQIGQPFIFRNIYII